MLQAGGPISRRRPVAGASDRAAQARVRAAAGPAPEERLRGYHDPALLPGRRPPRLSLSAGRAAVLGLRLGLDPVRRSRGRAGLLFACRLRAVIAGAGGGRETLGRVGVLLEAVTSVAAAALLRIAALAAAALASAAGREPQAAEGRLEAEWLGSNAGPAGGGVERQDGGVGGRICWGSRGEALAYVLVVGCVGCRSASSARGSTWFENTGRGERGVL